MHRTNVYLTDEQRAALAARALASFGVLRGSELDIDVDRDDGQRGVHLRRISRL